MLSNLFSTRNKKIVKRWRGEHKAIVVLANKAIEAYSTNDKEKTLKALKKLSKASFEHLMNEDIELYDLASAYKNDKQLKELIANFKDSFRNYKISLMDFLIHYTKDNAVYDKSFFANFNKLIEEFLQRIEFEEENLYTLLENKK